MLGQKIFEFRKKSGMSQENLAEKLNVARQTVSNWENGETSPNPEQLKMLSQVFDVSIDELLENKKFSENSDGKKENVLGIVVHGNIGFEYKSRTMVHGVPLLHVNIGGNGLMPRRAKGIIAIGDIATGVIALGGLSIGAVSFGGISVGALSFGGLALGILIALGGAAIAPVACGGFALGVVACGGGAIGLITNWK